MKIVKLNEAGLAGGAADDLEGKLGVIVGQQKWHHLPYGSATPGHSTAPDACNFTADIIAFSSNLDDMIAAFDDEYDAVEDGVVAFQIPTDEEVEYWTRHHKEFITLELCSEEHSD